MAVSTYVLFEKWHFVSKNFLTYCEKIFFYVCSNKKNSFKQFFEREFFLTYYLRFLMFIIYIIRMPIIKISHKTYISCMHQLWYSITEKEKSDEIKVLNNNLLVLLSLLIAFAGVVVNSKTYLEYVSGSLLWNWWSPAKLYILSTLNDDLILWNIQLIVYAVKC